MESFEKKYIEFFGIPSSGKTSVVDGLEKVLSIEKYCFPVQQVQTASWLMRSLQRVVKAGLGVLHSRRVRNLFTSLSSSGPSTVGEFKACVNFLWLAYSVEQSANKEKMSILTEGIFQAWWGLRVRGIVSNSSLAKVINFARSHGCRIVWLSCDLSTVRNRVSNRFQRSYVDNNKNSEEEIERSVQLVEFIIRKAIQEEIEVVKIDTGSQSLKKTVQKISNLV